MIENEFFQVKSLPDLFSCRDISKGVFVEEQGIAPELECVDITSCIHFLGTHKLAPVATGRIFPCANTARIQCVAVLPDFRRMGFGRTLMRTILDCAHEQGYTQAILEAQMQAVSFYSRLGFLPYDRMHTVAGIKHQSMSIQF